MRIYIVGAGPGDPDLITVKGLKILQSADVILYTDSLVNEELIAKAKPEAEVLKTAGMHLEEIVDVMVDRVKSGKIVVRIHTGDPSMYGAIMEQIALLKKEKIGYEVIPGVSSVFASAAAIGAELTIPDLTQTLIFEFCLCAGCIQDQKQSAWPRPILQQLNQWLSLLNSD